MVEQYLKKLGYRIRELRKSKQLSQEQLAELINKSRNYVGMIERAESNVSIKTYIEISIALNVHPKSLFEF